MSTRELHPALTVAANGNSGTGEALTTTGLVANTYTAHFYSGQPFTGHIEASGDGVHWQTVMVTDLSSDGRISSIAAAGIYRFDATGVHAVRAVVDNTGTDAVSVVDTMVKG